MEKKERLQLILEIIGKEQIQTQEELTQALKNHGCPVTQATVSRDIRDLGLIKTRIPGGRMTYTTQGTDQAGMADKFVRVMRDGITSLDQAQNILVIKTVSGMAMAVAAAVDSMKFPEVVGCIAGDDTIMAAVRTVEETTELIQKIRKLMIPAKK